MRRFFRSENENSIILKNTGKKLAILNYSGPRTLPHYKKIRLLCAGG
jgi:hypothetical protein